MDEVFADVSEITQVYVDAMKTARPLPVAGLHFMDADKELVNALTRLAQGEDVTRLSSTDGARPRLFRICTTKSDNRCDAS